MSQFDLYLLHDRRSIVCRLQVDFGLETSTVLCAPVVRKSLWRVPVTALHIPVDIEGEPHVIVMTQILTLEGKTLGPVVGSAREHRDAIIRAVDLIVVGF